MKTDEHEGWVLMSERQPDKFGHYIVFAESADEDIPFIAGTFYDPQAAGKEKNDGWFEVIPYWRSELTHWRRFPKPPAQVVTK